MGEWLCCVSSTFHNLGDIGTSCLAEEMPFTNLEHLTDNSPTAGHSDLYYDTVPNLLHTQLNRFIIRQNVIYPSFVLRGGKGPRRDVFALLTGRPAKAEPVVLYTTSRLPHAEGSGIFL